MDSNVSAWTVGSSIFTFAPLWILFTGVAVALWIIYTKPGLTPGRRPNGVERPAIFTPQPGAPAAAEAAEQPQGDSGGGRRPQAPPENRGSGGRPRENTE